MKDLFSQMPYKEAAKDSARPIRVWDSKAKKHYPGRNYKYARNALDGALLLARWAGVGETLEILDARTGKVLGTYKRQHNTVAFYGPQTPPKEGTAA